MSPFVTYGVKYVLCKTFPIVRVSDVMGCSKEHLPKDSKSVQISGCPFWPADTYDAASDLDKRLASVTLVEVKYECLVSRSAGMPCHDSRFVPSTCLTL